MQIFLTIFLNSQRFYLPKYINSPRFIFSKHTIPPRFYRSILMARGELSFRIYSRLDPFLSHKGTIVSNETDEERTCLLGGGAGRSSDRSSYRVIEKTNLNRPYMVDAISPPVP